MKILNNFGAMLLGAVILLFTAMPACAEEVTLLYTGETHAMLYPCNCPIEPDGGIARRAQLVKNIRQTSSNVILLDSGAYFAGGLMDEYTQSTELDMLRTETALKAMEYMKYDAVAIGDEEFNFGRQYLEDALKRYRLAFVSSNSNIPGSVPYVVKKLKGLTIGIIGVTPVTALPKAGGIEIVPPIPAIASAITALKAAGADCIVLLSHLGEADDIELIKAIEGIDVVVVGGGRLKQEPFSKEGSTLVLRPSWQGRRLGKAVLKVKDRKIKDFSVEEIRLSDGVPDDPGALALGPRCFMDSNCKKASRMGSCIEPGTKNARCVFPQEVKIPLTVIIPKNCYFCQVDTTVESYQKQFPGITLRRILYPGAEAEKIIKDLGLTTLPAYIFGSELSRDSEYAGIKDRFDEKNGFFVLKPQFAGIAMFLNRPAIPGRIDVFLSLYDPNITTLYITLKNFLPAYIFWLHIKALNW